ncbi:alpha amylase family protein [Paenibacillus sediminis]|uniref:Uncharacterized lipoprotein YddW (UPF0748 family) n=1 Tax=Paenibacillus sediminis TaxID=664909 RepID=A0ABS4GYG6_9BACL|nr:alpha amylase family protein [Paenibacillus sediminis]MBP1935271.1 uncharacterized lipoprotein YddW (UPF0748 family) [Paenibacillus sediminis]
MKQSIEKDANILWVDFIANGVRLADRAERQRLVNSAKRAGVTHLVVDAKIPYGHTTYPSAYAYHVSRWSDGRYKVWEGRDFLAEMIQEAQVAGLSIIANVDVFTEGTTRSKDGIAYEKRDWQVMLYKPSLSSEPMAAENADDDTIFVNPIHEEVTRHELGILKEIAEKYDIAGIVLDRCRYPNVYGDFSELSRRSFETYIQQPVEQWPRDIFTLKDGTKQIEFGKWFGKWTEWRALNIKHFVQSAKKLVNSINPNLLFSIYVGSWYPLYYNEGVNWASSTYRANLPWASKDYHVSAYADELDFIMTGCYYPEVRIEEAVHNGRPAEWYSVEGAIKMSLEAINGQIPVIASLYLKDYEGNHAQFAKAVSMCKERTNGVMLFDVSYLDDYSWWEGLEFDLSVK